MRFASRIIYDLRGSRGAILGVSFVLLLWGALFLRREISSTLPFSVSSMSAIPSSRFSEVAAHDNDEGAPDDHRSFDAVIVAAGGQTKDGPPPHVVLRLQQALKLYQRQLPPPKIITTARGTPHKPSPLDQAGFEVHECQMNAKWLMDHGVKAEHILEESSSLETVGNAYFTRVLHTDVAGLTRLAVVNNRWHMKRTRLVFEHVFGMAPDQGYTIAFYSVGDGLPKDVLERRLAKEEETLPKFAEGGPWRKHTANLRELHTWINLENTAYAAKRLFQERKPLDPKLADSY